MPGQLSFDFSWFIQRAGSELEVDRKRSTRPVFYQLFKVGEMILWYVNNLLVHFGTLNTISPLSEHHIQSKIVADHIYMTIIIYNHPAMRVTSSGQTQ